MKRVLKYVFVGDKVDVMDEMIGRRGADHAVSCRGEFQSDERVVKRPCPPDRLKE